MTMATEEYIRPADGLNLATAIVNLTNSSGIVAGYAKDLLRWLSRQGVDEHAFEACAKLARGLAIPNKNGLQLRRGVLAADARIPLLNRLSVKLWYSGSLGRMMLKDDDYCYMVSTVASLIEYHNLEFAKTALTSMMLDQGGHQEECKPKYHIQRAPVMAVISKIVESIYLNVTNVGHRAVPLPEALGALHPHLLDDTTFAAIVMSVQRNENNLLLRSTKFPADIVQWLFNHFEGKLVVYLGNEEIYSEVLGESDQVIKCMIEERCTVDTITCERRDWPIQLLEISEFFPKRNLVNGSTDGEARNDPATRREMYSLKALFDKKTNNNIFSVAKDMLIWLLAQKVERGVASDVAIEPAGFTLSCPDEETVSVSKDREFKIADLLGRTPELLNRNTGVRLGSAPVFVKPTQSSETASVSSRDTDFDFSGQQQPLEDLFLYFPAAEDLLKTMQEMCSCQACHRKQSLELCNWGCKRYNAISAVATLLCHAIADGFGAEDVAQHLEPSTALSGVFSIFGDIIFQQVVRWDTWFKIVAVVIQGCDWIKANDGTLEEGGTCWIGTQYGSSVVTAAWLRHDWPLRLRGCFAAAIYEGSVPGIDEIASIISERTAAAEELQTTLEAVRLAASEFKEEFVIFRAESECYRRMSIVTAGRAMRVVDVAAKMTHVSRSTQPSCKHPVDQNSDVVPDDVRIFPISDILKSWGRQTYLDSTVHVSKTLESAHEISVALALAYGGAVLWNLEKCCWQCAYNMARRESLKYVISFLIGQRKLR